MSNIIVAIKNLVSDPQLELGNYYNSRHRANAEGDSLEEYIKDLYSGTLREANEEERARKIRSVFSYIGNDSNPPDAMLFGEDAIEVKKLETAQGDIQLNSSHPKCKLYSSSPMINEECKRDEGGNWIEKDLLYIIGSVRQQRLRSMFMVYGIDYAASEEKYLLIKSTIKNGVENLPGIQFAETDELGRINRIDPLGLTSLRVRGMWILQNPWRHFSYLTSLNRNCAFDFCAIINTKKYELYSERFELERMIGAVDGLRITDEQIKKPDNPTELIDAKMIRFTIA